MADTRYEVPVSYRVTRASRAEVEEPAPAKAGVLDEMVDEELGDWTGRCRDFSADRGLDCGALKAKRWQGHGVRPLIEPRELWREEKAMPSHDPAQPIARACTPNGRTASCTPRRVGCIADARARGSNATWRSGGSTRGATRSSTGVRRRPAASRARAAWSASGWGAAKRGSTGAWRYRARPARPAHLHPHPLREPRMEARLPPAHGLGTDQRPCGPRLRVRAALPPGQLHGCARAWAWRSRRVRCAPGAPNGCVRCTARFLPLSRGQALGRHRLTG